MMNHRTDLQKIFIFFFTLYSEKIEKEELYLLLELISNVILVI